MRSTRYGAISSRLGRVHNTLAAIVFSDTEIFSNLELTQHVYDRLKGDNEELDFPLIDGQILEAVYEATNKLLSQVVGRMPVVLRGDVLDRVREETIALYRNPDDVKNFLVEVDKGYSKTSK